MPSGSGGGGQALLSQLRCHGKAIVSELCFPEPSPSPPPGCLAAAGGRLLPPRRDRTVLWAEAAGPGRRALGTSIWEEGLEPVMMSAPGQCGLPAQSAWPVPCPHGQPRCQVQHGAQQSHGEGRSQPRRAPLLSVAAPLGTAGMRLLHCWLPRQQSVRQHLRPLPSRCQDRPPPAQL